MSYRFQQITYHAIALSHRYGGIFISLINIKNFSPYAIVIIYNLLTNRWLEYGIIRWWEYDDAKNCHILYEWNGVQKNLPQNAIYVI